MLVNGLGATKYEELFALFGEVAAALEAAGVELVAPEVGELVTSLDMAGCSLTVTWLDDELERLWLAPADTPAFRRGNRWSANCSPSAASVAIRSAETAVAEEASEESIAAAAVARRAVAALYDTVEENKEYLGQIDAIAGDGDHGIGMSRGARRPPPRPRTRPRVASKTVLVAAGRAFGDKAGGTSGILWGLLLDGVGKGLGNTETVTAAAGGRGRRAVRAPTCRPSARPKLGRQDDARLAVPVRRYAEVRGRRRWRIPGRRLEDGGAGLRRGGRGHRRADA